MRPNAGGVPDAAFKFTKDERYHIDLLLNHLASTAFDWKTQSISDVIDDIEEIINQGWQTCACDAAVLESKS